MNESVCLICHSKCFFYYQNIDTITSKQSKKPIKDILTDILGKSQPQSNKLDSLCYECFDKINVYDWAKLTVDNIIRDFRSYSNRRSDGKQNQLSSQSTTIQEENNFEEKNNQMDTSESVNKTDEYYENDDIFALYEVLLTKQFLKYLNLLAIDLH